MGGEIPERMVAFAAGTMGPARQVVLGGPAEVEGLAAAASQRPLTAIKQADLAISGVPHSTKLRQTWVKSMEGLVKGAEHLHESMNPLNALVKSSRAIAWSME